MFCLLVIGTSVDSLHGQSFTQRVVRRLRSPVFALSPPNDPDRLFVVELGSGGTATTRILDLSTNEVLPDPFLTINNMATGGERGFLGMAFHPDYQQNGKFYTYVSIPGGSRDHRSQVREYTVTGDPRTSNAADPNSMKPVITFDQPFGNHNAGWLGFDPTATGPNRTYLHIATGDGGSGGDPQNNSQNINNLLGNILRIDIDGDDFASNTRNYAVPPDNPFVDAAGADEIWAYGLRNPYRTSFDRRTGDLWIGDVGQNAREEIDLLPNFSLGGENFGWRVREGSRCFDNGQTNGNPPCSDSSLVAPVYDYAHGSGEFQGNSVTGGYVYRGSAAEFQGHYFFADFVSSNVWTLDPFSSGPAVVRRNDQLVPDEGRLSGSISSFAEDDAGELYIISIGGTIFRVASTSRESRWFGSSSESGAAGDGATWEDAANWVRDGVVDAGYVEGDEVVFGNDPLNALEVTSSQRVAALRFESDYRLTIGENADLEVSSGNISVAAGAAVEIVGRIQAETSGHSIRKLGPGRLQLPAPANLAVLEGTATTDGELELLTIAGGGVLEHAATQESLTISALDAQPESTIRLFPELQNDAGQALLDVEQASLAGRLDIQPAADYQPPTERGMADLFALMTTDMVRGDFSEVTFHDAAVGHQGDGLFFLLETTGGLWSLVSHLAVAGDANGDRLVDFQDFLSLSASFGGPGDWIDGDFDQDGTVRFADFLQLAAGFDSSTPTPAISIPEPASSLLVLFAVLVVLRQAIRIPRRCGSGFQPE